MSIELKVDCVEVKLFVNVILFYLRNLRIFFYIFVFLGFYGFIF